MIDAAVLRFATEKRRCRQPACNRLALGPVVVCRGRVGGAEVEYVLCLDCAKGEADPKIQAALAKLDKPAFGGKG